MSAAAPDSRAPLQPAPANPLGPGSLLGPYKIEALLGRGGMGAVYRARHRDGGADVALKTLLSKHRDVSALIRFEREAQAVAKLRHRNVVGIRELFRAQDQLCMAMELIEGESLLELCIRRGFVSGQGLELKRVLDIMIGVADALSFCHKKGLVHRDLKAANILIERDTDRAVLVDFGLVRFVTGDESEVELTQDGQVLGTLHSMAPEQLDPSLGPVSDRTDSWAFGACLMRVLCGRNPYDGDDRLSLVRSMLQGQARRVREVWPEAPDWLDELCARCLRSRANQRPSMTSIAQVLRAQSLPDEGKRRRSALLPIFGLIGIGLLAAAPRPKKTPETLVLSGLPESPLWTDEASYKLSLLLNLDASLRVQHRYGDPSNLKVKLDKTRETKARKPVPLSLALEPGLNELELSASVDAQTLNRKLVIGLLEAEPQLELLPPARRWRGSWVYRRGEPLKFKLASTNPWTLRAYDRELLAKDGIYELEPQSDGELSFELTPPRGDSRIKRISIFSLKDPADPWRELREVELWSAASSSLRRVYAELVDRACRTLTLLRLERFECAEQSHEIAIYRLDGLALEMALIPGARTSLGLRDRAAEAAYCEDFERRNPEDFDTQWLQFEPDAHEVELEPFFIARRELTWRQWCSLGGRAPIGVESDAPANAIQVLPLLEIIEGKTARALELRLPTDDEWEYAYRAGSKSRFFWGDELDIERDSRYFGAVSLNNSAIRATAPNAFGLFDMPFSAFEWARLETEKSELGSYSTRGGGWPEKHLFMRATHRRSHGVKSVHMAGLRPAMSLPELPIEDHD